MYPTISGMPAKQTVRYCEQQQQDGNPGKEGYGVARRPTRHAPVTGAHASADGDGRTHRQACNHHCQHVHDLGSHGNSRNGVCAAVLSGDEQIRHAIECLKETAEKIRKRKPQKVSKHAPLSQILFLHLFSSRQPHRLSMDSPVHVLPAAADDNHTIFHLLGHQAEPGRIPV